MPRTVRILALLGFVLAAATPVAAQGPLARTYAAYGFRALGSGDFGGAVREFTEALELYPLYVDAYVGRAMAGIAQDRLLEAWGDLQRAKRYDDDPGRKAAIEELMQGVEVTSRLASYAAFLAGVGKNDEYISELRRVLQLRPDYPYAELRLADALSAQGNLREAEMHYLAALRADPKLTVAYNNLGKVYLSQGHISQAVVQFNEALRLNPGYKEAEENLRVAKAADAQVFPAARR